MDTASKKSVYAIIGASNHSKTVREANDYYATDPKALELLLDIETFDPFVWECACGEGHLSEVLKRRGYVVRSSDLIDRGYGESGVDFLSTTERFNGDIITNPPYSMARQFAEHALDIVCEDNRVAMFLKLTFLESKGRRPLFEKYPPEYVYVSSNRLLCAKNGELKIASKDAPAAVAYGWYIWRKGFTGEPKVRWFN